MSKEFIIYMTRWQLSGFIMLIPYYAMIALGVVNPTINMIIASFFGGLIFYKIDQTIFKGGFEWKNAHTVVRSILEKFKTFIGINESEADYVNVTTAQGTSK